MAVVIVPSLLRALCDGVAKHTVPGGALRDVLLAVDAECPGFFARVVEAGQVRPELALALNGEVLSLALHDVIGANAEIAIVPAIGGG